MILKLIFLFTTLFTTICYAQAQLFSNSYTQSSHGLTANASTLLADGNLITVGNSSATIQTESIIISKTNAITGNTIWTKIFSKPGHRLTALNVDELLGGEIIVSGNTVDSNIIGFHPQMFVLKTNAVGDIIWSKIYDFTNGFTGIFNTVLKPLSDNSFILCGASFDSIGITIQRIDSSGTIIFSKRLWIDSIVGASASITDMIAVSDGYLFSGNANYDGNFPNLLLVKTDTLGNVEWVKSNYQFGLPQPYVSKALLFQTPDSNIMVVLSDFTYISLLKTDLNGNAIWYKHIKKTGSVTTQPYLKFASIDSLGNFLFGGITDFQPNPNSNNTYHKHAGKGFLIETNSSGSILRNTKYSLGKNFNTVSFIHKLSNNNIVISGTLNDTIVYAPTSINRHFYFMNLDSLGNSHGLSCGLDTAFNVVLSNDSLPMFVKPYHEYTGFSLANYSLVDETENLTVSPVSISPTVSILLLPTFLCQGQMATFTATPVNGGTNPMYNFTVNGVSVQNSLSNIYSSTTLNHSDTVECFITSNAPCVLPAIMGSNEEVMEVYPSVNATIFISANPIGVVPGGTPIIFTATTTNAGPTPFFSWEKNAIPVGTNSATYTDSTLLNGDFIMCNVSSSFCAPLPTVTSNILTMTANGILKINEQNKFENTFTISPNPAHDEIEIVTSDYQMYTMTIKDIYGRVMLKRRNLVATNKINISFLPVGIYFVEMEIDKNVSTKKLVKLSY